MGWEFLGFLFPPFSLFASVQYIIPCMYTCTYIHWYNAHTLLLYNDVGSTLKSDPVEVEGGILLPYNLPPDR